MKPCQRLFTLVSICTVLIAGANPAMAQTVFWAPESVQAVGDGSFSFIAGITAGDDCVGIWGYHYEGVENIEASMWADTFCIDPQPIAPGEIISFVVSGVLTDPAMPGVVFSEMGCCNVSGEGATTTVVPPAVASGRSSWGTLKARYH
ncbi:hypothetical protein DRQ50_12365 [bacterium]|nr:MAG: hypothetical protein DRQ50_12365 [bacterium]